MERRFSRGTDRNYRSRCCTSSLFRNHVKFALGIDEGDYVSVRSGHSFCGGTRCRPAERSEGGRGYRARDERTSTASERIGWGGCGDPLCSCEQRLLLSVLPRKPLPFSGVLTRCARSLQSRACVVGTPENASPFQSHPWWLVGTADSTPNRTVATRRLCCVEVCEGKRLALAALVASARGGNRTTVAGNLLPDSIPPASRSVRFCTLLRCEGRGSNPRTSTRADLESAAVDRLATLARSRRFVAVV